MLFNSIDFAIFLPVVFIIYWFVVNKNLKLQNFFIVISSYVFYGWWDWRFLSLILFSTLVDYAVGVALSKQNDLSKRKILLWISILVNLGFLGFFKYYNFFLDNFVTAFSFFGTEIQGRSLNIILPVGISFYTFQTLSYTIDVYRRQLEPTKNFVSFAAFVSFFPQLVAGPIERASNLLPQFYVKRQFNSKLAIDGLRQIIWGLFKKVVIADNCAQFANDIFNNYTDYSSSTLLLGAIYFAFQIYGDFSGYSDIAIGTSKLFGFNLKQNFATPYFSRDIAEFWRRWHISLSTWFRDYLYIPLGGSRGSKGNQIRNVFIIFIVSGFWHGANWTFIIWGALNAVYFLPLLLKNKNRVHTNVVAENSWLPNLKELFQMVTTFGFTIFAWIFFRAENVEIAFLYIKNIFKFSIELSDRLKLNRFAFELLPLLSMLILIEWFSRQKEHPIKNVKHPTVFMLLIVLLIVVFGSFSNIQEFIYFQF
ncbi:D-alanyl-lipoteichoic acid acyltransferase DltB (MBOAT superfamily) [Winogradskyella epiphytica]|uniref:D-alanyl-lipoteichoic acid acyltransferase DltB (MBOAT superfamily) n=1 Tax=Winogradskyella epiphytica TaxID=262005 RepID=A0A2V4WYP0_9FLAO|nr:MBOAT family O-acyltransferase [Winogradskyella epiphytica]PYE82132.1 D-alanyl-lipoteichoic acid acyltransferase DltB (MBOAT superfamily) [Winogradskyella epiphytica]GGW60319.1 O-acyltransferase [Winogradskyella epiphytica]